MKIKAKNHQPSTARGFTPLLEDGIAPSFLPRKFSVSVLWHRIIKFFTARGTQKTMPSFSTGFTLIELLVVIAIIGILSSVVLASLSGARGKSRDAKRISDLSQLKLALTLWNDANNARYPLLLSSLAPTYIQSIPTDPLVGGIYTYTPSGCTTTCTNFILSATLETTNSVLANDANTANNDTFVYDVAP